MNFLGNAAVAVAAEGRLFGLDLQLVFDALITTVNVFILFIILSYVLFNPVRDMLKKRQEKIAGDIKGAEDAKEEALALKAEYDEKLKAVEAEADAILSEARKTAMKNEQKIIDEAKEEAARIIARANTEAELEKKKAVDDVKKEIVVVAKEMAAKLVAKSLDDTDQDALIEQTINEMGDNTWLS